MRRGDGLRVTVAYPKFEQAQRMIAAAGAEPATGVCRRCDPALAHACGTEEALCHDLSELTRGSAEVT